MADTEKFSEMIAKHLTRHRTESIRRQSALNSDMENLLKSRAAFEGEAQHVLSSIVLPRIRAMARHFENADVKEAPEKGLNCSCHFTHNERFPATVKLSVTIEPRDNNKIMKIYQTVEILPEFIDYERHETLQVPLGKSSDSVLGNWVEVNLLRFIDTYLQLETHPIYQKDNLVTDPICGMVFPPAEAEGCIDNDGRKIHFCSAVCRDAYRKEFRNGDSRETED